MNFLSPRVEPLAHECGIMEQKAEGRQRAFTSGSINESWGTEEPCFTGIMLVVGQKEQVRGKKEVFQHGRGEITSHFCVISCTTPAALHPERERLFNLSEALTPEGAALSLSAPAP